VKLQVLRKGKQQTFNVKLDQMPDQPKVAAATPDSQSTDTILGLTLSKIDKASRRKFGLPEGIEGVLVVDAEEGPGVNLRPGDVIVEVGSEPVVSPEQVAAKVKEAREAGRGAVLLRVSRGGTEQFVAVAIKKA